MSKFFDATTRKFSTTMSYVCGETSKNFINLKSKKEMNNDALRFGLSILRAKIRLFEHLLRLAVQTPDQKCCKSKQTKVKWQRKRLS